MSVLDQPTAETWLYREARLLDERRYDDWFALWEPDGVYWIPSNEDDYDPSTHVSLLLKDWVGLRDRVERLDSGSAYSQDPPSRLRRLISNVEVGVDEPPLATDGQRAAGADGELVTVRSNFLLVELRRHVRDVFAGTSIHTLRVHDSAGVESERDDASIGIVTKVVRLLDNDEPIDNLTFLL